ncbi:MAG: hypothetical protein DSY35_04870 [Desulfurobacterium sp.]|nr:MAG: hypothetical protein DSY35_04870 [Desulfurobacterium sp.]
MEESEFSFRTLAVLPEQLKNSSDKEFLVKREKDKLLFFIRLPNNLWVEIGIPLREILRHLPTDGSILNDIADKVPVGILLFREKVVYSNDFLEKLLEKSREAIINSPVSEVLPKEIGKRLKKLLSREGVEKRLTIKWIGPLESPSGVKRTVLIIASSAELREEITGIAFLFDITAEKYFLEKMEDIYSYDVVTELPNFRKALEFIENLKRQQKKFLVGIVDINNFYVVNDSLGIETGDKVLKKFAEVRSLDLTK